MKPDPAKSSSLPIKDFTSKIKLKSQWMGNPNEPTHPYHTSTLFTTFSRLRKNKKNILIDDINNYN